MGSGGGATTTSPSATTPATTWPSRASSSTTSPSATTGSRASSDRPTPTASTRTRPPPTASGTPSTSAPCPRSGTAWPTWGCRRATTTATCRSSPSTAPSTCRSRPRSTEFFADAAAGHPAVVHLPRSGASSGRPRTTTTRTPTSAGARTSWAGSCRRLVESPQWASTLLIITYDEWGGFFDTVAPAAIPGPRGQPRRQTRPAPTTPRPGSACRPSSCRPSPVGGASRRRPSSTPRSSSSSSGGSACRRSPRRRGVQEPRQGAGLPPPGHQRPRRSSCRPTLGPIPAVMSCASPPSGRRRRQSPGPSSRRPTCSVGGRSARRASQHRCTSSCPPTSCSSGAPRCSSPACSARGWPTGCGCPACCCSSASGMAIGDDGLDLVSLADAELTQGLAVAALVRHPLRGRAEHPVPDLREVAAPALSLATIGVFATAGVRRGRRRPAPRRRRHHRPADRRRGGLDGRRRGVLRAAAAWPCPRRLGHLLEAESGANDPMAVLLTVGLLGGVGGPRRRR